MTHAYAWEPLIDAAWPRFVAKVDAREALGCWLWTGATSSGAGNTAPYGSFYVGRVEGREIFVRAHIFACAAAGIVIPRGHHRDHLCKRTLCIAPHHADPTTPRENSLRRHGRGWGR